MIEARSYFRGPPKEMPEQSEEDLMNEINDSDLDMLLEDLELEEEISNSDESMK